MLRLFYNTGMPFGDAQRDLELEQAVSMNQKSNLFGEMIDMNFKDRQPLYAEVFDKANEITKEDDINIFCNLDMIFDETIRLTEQMLKSDFYCLTRWEGTPTTQYPNNLLEATWTHMNRVDSQDVWIWKGQNIVPRATASFPIGIAGCDNSIAYHIYRAGYRVSNPSLSIKTYHWHFTNLRKWKTTNIRAEPPYLCLRSSSLEHPIYEQRRH